MIHHEDAGWANPRVLAILAVVFLCGSVVGATAMRSYFHRHLPPAQAHHTFLYHGKAITFETLKSELNLTSDQEQAVKRALDDYAKYYQNLEEQREDVTETGKRRIYAALNREQKQRFALLLREPAPAN
jgi:hypothetical protein